MRPKIFLCRTIPADLHWDLARRCELWDVDPASLLTPSAAAEGRHWADVEGLLISGGKTVGPLALDAMPRLRVISTISVGYDALDVADLTRRGILLMHTPDVLTETTADMIFLLILSAGRRLMAVSDLLRSGGWKGSLPEEYFGTDIYGKTLGILGMGRIGYAVAKRAHAGFGMEVLYYSRSANQKAEADFQARRCGLDELLARSDYVCVILPLSEETRKLIGRREFSLMKPSAFIVNGGRGPVIDEDAMIEALQQGTIAGAGLDVYEQEPLSANSPLLTLPQVVALPHIGSATHETRRAMIRCAIDNLFAALEGAPRRNCVNPEAAGDNP